MTHAEARRIVEEAWRRVHGRAPTDLETAYTQAIAWGENRYGRAGQFAEMAARGAHNWGSLHAKGSPPDCPPGSVEGFDLRPVCFLAFPDDVSAAAAYVRVLTKQHWPTVNAMQGSPEDVARAMRVAPAYYEGTAKTEDEKVQAYANLIRRSLRDIESNVPIPEAKRSSMLPWLLGLGLLGGGAWYVYRFGVPTGLARALRKL